MKCHKSVTNSSYVHLEYPILFLNKHRIQIFSKKVIRADSFLSRFQARMPIDQLSLVNPFLTLKLFHS